MAHAEREGRRILIFGAGRIGRGFISHLATRSGYRVRFVDPDAGVVGRLNQGGCYTVHVMGAPERSQTITGVSALQLGDAAALRQAVDEHDLMATAVGGQNLASLGALLGAALRSRLDIPQSRPVDVLVCENYKDAAAILRGAIIEGAADPRFAAWAERNLGVVATQILKTCTIPDAALRPGPLDVQVENAWRLPCDRAAFRGGIPPIEGLEPKDDFGFAAIQKLYTYNCTNAVISYLGHLRGHQWLCEAAVDPLIDKVVVDVMAETQPAYVAEFNFDPQTQQAFHTQAIQKYRDQTIRDPIQRNARDIERKLGPEDRLVGPALLVLKHGGTPTGLCMGIAAALHYTDPGDPPTCRVRSMLATHGLTHTLQAVCGLTPDHPLVPLIEKSIASLAPFNRIGAKLLASR